VSTVDQDHVVVCGINDVEPLNPVTKALVATKFESGPFELLINLSSSTLPIKMQAPCWCTVCAYKVKADEG
jgi:hypothetical protein